MSKTHTDSDSGTDAEAKPKADNVDDAKDRDAEASDGKDIDAGSDASEGSGSDATGGGGSGSDASGSSGSDAGAGSQRDTEALPPVTEAQAPADDELPARLRATAPRQWRNRATPWLFAAVLLAGGFLGGVQVQKIWGKSTTVSSGASQGGSSGQTPDLTPPSGFSGGGGFRAGTDSQETTGTLKSVTTNALTIRTKDGKTRTVKIGESTRIQQSVTIAKLKPGRPIAIQGSTAADGTVTATAVTVS